jgi:type IV pilus assembly protein PilC
VPKFAFEGTTPQGIVIRGAERFPSREDAELALFRRQLGRLSITEKKSVWRMEVLAPRVKRQEVMHLSRQLAAFVRAGLPVLDAVHTIGEEAANSSLRRVMQDVEEGLRSGERLSDCLDRHPKIFPEFYRGILRSAELTGRLDTVLDQLAGYLERDLEARRKIKSALIYPSVVAVMSTFTIVVLAGFVLPRFKVFFAGLHAKLPLPTRILLGITDFVGAWWWLILAVLSGLALVVSVAVRTEPGRRVRDRLLLAVPVLGVTVQFALVERFCRMLGSMLGAGVTLPEALRVTSAALSNRVYTGALKHVGEAMLEGHGIAAPIARTRLFPATATQMIRVGEDTGTLDEQLEVAAQYYERELDYQIKRVTALFEPAMIIVMGGLVGFVAVALVSAMYGIFNQVQV